MSGLLTFLAFSFLSIYPSTYLSSQQFICMSVYPSFIQSACFFSTNKSLYSSSIQPSSHVSTYLPIYCHDLGVWLQTGYEFWSFTLQLTGTYRLVYSVYYSLHQPFPGNGFNRGRFFSFPRSGPLIRATRAELLSTNSSTNWVPDWRPFHTNLLVVSLHRLTFNWTVSLTNQVLHVTELVH
jgi:hypothetical protein